MRLLLALLVAAVLLSGAFAYSYSTQSTLRPGLWTIRITVETIKVTRGPGFTTTQELAYNRRITKHAIGNLITICHNLGRGGLLGDGLQWCEGSLSLPHGRITYQGRRYGTAAYTNSVVGGTGLYRNVGGELLSTLTAEREHQLVFELVAFSVKGE